MATRRTFTAVNPGEMFTPEQAYTTITGYGIPLDQHLDRAKAIAGWSGAGPVAGEGINRILSTAAGEMDADFLPWGGTPAAPPPAVPGLPPAAGPAPGAGASGSGAFPPISRGQFTLLDPAATYDPTGAQSYLSTIIGEPLDPYLQEAIQIALNAGWGGSGTPLLGQYINPIIQEAQRRMTGGAGGGTGSTGPVTPTATPGTPPLANAAGRATNSGLIPPGDTSAFSGEVVAAGTDPLSAGITQRLLDLLQYEGSTAFGDEIGRNLLGLVRSGGRYEGEVRTPGSDLESALELVAQSLLEDPGSDAAYESAREMNQRGRRASMASLRGELANRGLLSEPGIDQGAEIEGILNTEAGLGAEFATALRDISIDRARRRSEGLNTLVSGASQLGGLKLQDQSAIDQRMLTSLQLATGMSADQASTLLATAGQGTARQDMLARVALQSLAQNQAWSQFLAEFGLERDRMMYDIEQGQVAGYIPLINAFLQVASLSRGGYI